VSTKRGSDFKFPKTAKFSFSLRRLVTMSSAHLFVVRHAERGGSWSLTNAFAHQWSLPGSVDGGLPPASRVAIAGSPTLPRPLPESLLSIAVMVHTRSDLVLQTNAAHGQRRGTVEAQSDGMVWSFVLCMLRVCASRLWSTAAVDAHRMTWCRIEELRISSGENSMHREPQKPDYCTERRGERGRRFRVHVDGRP
jgi:hypothetical protein